MRRISYIFASACCSALLHILQTRNAEAFYTSRQHHVSPKMQSRQPSAAVSLRSSIRNTPDIEHSGKQLINNNIGEINNASRKDGRISDNITLGNHLNPIEAALVKYMMITYIAHMCVALPLTLVPTAILRHFKLLSRTECEHRSLKLGQKCARTLLQWIPFLKLNVIPYDLDVCDNAEPVPSIWVCNHVSMLDVFVILASDEEFRGVRRRPAKAIYWKGLDGNPIVKILFTMAGFITVDMADNGNGNPNEYNKESFKNMLKETKRAIAEGFDVLVLPEGQLNPTPEQGLQPVLPGAYALAKSSGRPVRMFAIHGCHNLWSADDSIGMTVVDNDVTVRVYPPLSKEFDSAKEFADTFCAVVGHFGATGHDLPDSELKKWFDGIDA